ncbi:MAG TPA: carbamoyltransferase C-terminal domain-containing protein [Streptosporangiaceae bacterium]|nr:carbamoyltransferase C-terminal domain-containing protein [Streptosporangiaceae bacterium]
MLVLGLNGKFDGHDPAAALLRDGQLAGAVEEERFTRTRHAPTALPHNAAAWVLAQAGAGLDDVDVVALGWDPRLQPDAPEPAGEGELLDMLLPPTWFPRRRRPPLLRVRHHLAHAASATAGAPFGRGACLVVDGSGERESITAWKFDGATIDELWSLPYAQSLGFFYEAATLFTGLGKYSEGKTMGLAAWGDAERYPLPSPVFDPPVAVAGEPDSGHYLDVLRGWIDRFAAVTGQRRLRRVKVGPPAAATLTTRTPEIGRAYRDLAAAVQHTLQREMLALARQALADAGATRLCLAGGVALNCVANGVLATALNADQIYLPPAAHDGGVALGAAAWATTRAGIAVRLPDHHVYAGPAWSAGAVADLLTGWGLPFSAPDDPEEGVAELLAEGSVVARFAGQAELGPRALGARSILADPGQAAMLHRVNALKRREVWRPLAPSLPAEHGPSVFGLSLDSPFMLVSLPVTEAMRELIPAVVHVDGSTRPQLLTEDTNPSYHRLLTAFAKLTSRPAVLNTSFNVAGPIVLSPEQAVATFMTSGIDVLAIEGLLVRKDGRG